MASLTNFVPCGGVAHAGGAAGDAIARLQSDAQTFVGVAARTGAGASARARRRPVPRRAASTSVVMYAVATATIISGPTASPADDVSRSAMTTEDSGSRS